MEQCNCPACTIARKIRGENEESERVTLMEVKRNENAENASIAFEKLRKAIMEMEESEKSVAVTAPEVVEKPVIKDFIYAQTKQYFTETNQNTGAVKEDYFRIPERKERVIHSQNATIVILHDGTKGVAKCHPADDMNRTKGIKIAYTRAKIKLLQKELKNLTK